MNIACFATLTPQESEVLLLIAGHVQRYNQHGDLIDLDLERSGADRGGELMVNALIFAPRHGKTA